MIKLRYGNTNTFFIPGDRGGLLVDTDWAGTLPLFYKAIKAAGLEFGRITHVLATHYHPDHMGLIGQLQEQGVVPVLVDAQHSFAHASDAVFARDPRLRFVPVDESRAAVIPCAGSRAFLAGQGIHGEIIATPSHSEDAVSLLLDDGTCIVGDLEPLSYLDAYEDNPRLRRDWNEILRRSPKRILYAHANEQTIG